MSTLRDEIREFSQECEILTAKIVSEYFDVSQRDANNALAALTRTGELTRVQRGQYTAADGAVQTGVKAEEPDSQKSLRGATLTALPTSSTVITVQPSEVDGEVPDLVEWLAEQFDLDPERLYIAFAYYTEFLAAG